jgi:hypothetical protein
MSNHFELEMLLNSGEPLAQRPTKTSIHADRNTFSVSLNLIYAEYRRN